MKKAELIAHAAHGKRTLLGVGPVSKNCVDATIELANQHAIPIFLVASRRQVECADRGGGYVENWSTEQFIRYVRARDKGGYAILARDHGGPWQHNSEDRLNLDEAMRSAKESLAADIAAGMEMIHIDSSLGRGTPPTIEQSLDRLFELYEFCHATSRRHGRSLAYEVGTDPQDIEIHDLEVFAHQLQRVVDFCRRERLPSPMFAVAQTGTRVTETRNIGIFSALVRPQPADETLQKIRALVAACERQGVWLKAHNTDYLSEEHLRLFPSLGIHAANVAPEIGVVETRAMLRLLRHPSLQTALDGFMQLALESGQWRKWVLSDSQTTELERVEIAGHYVFSHPAFKLIKEQAALRLQKQGIDLNGELKTAVGRVLQKYLLHFNLIEGSPPVARRESHVVPASLLRL